MSLLRTRNFWTPANVFTSSPKTWHVNKKDFLEHSFVAGDQWTWYMCCDADFNSAWTYLPYYFLKHPLKQYFLDIYLTTFSESVTSKIQNLWGSSFYSKSLNVNLDFKAIAKILEIFFFFRHNCIWIRIVKLSLLRTGYFLLVANVLTRYPQIWHVNKWDFFEQNFVASDQWVWYSCCDADFNTVWARLPYCFSKLPLKRDFLEIYLTTILKSVTSKI